MPGAALTAAAEVAPRYGSVLHAAARAASAGGDAADELRGDPDLRAVGLAWSLGQDTGAPLAEVLERVADDLAATDEQRRAVLVALSGPRSSAVLLAGLPVVGIALGASMGARPLAFLTAAGAGRLVCLLGVLLDAAGVMWMRRILRQPSAREDTTAVTGSVSAAWGLLGLAVASRADAPPRGADWSAFGTSHASGGRQDREAELRRPGHARRPGPACCRGRRRCLRRRPRGHARAGCGAVVAAVVWPVLGWLQRRPTPQAPDPALPLVLDLIAAALRSGRPLADALDLAADAARADVAGGLRRVAGLWRLGADAGQAWSVVAPGGPLAVVAPVAIRSAQSGIKIAAAFERLAAELRAERAARQAARAHRAGVLAMGPLAACFLPSFVCLGVVPVIVGIATSAFDVLPASR